MVEIRKNYKPRLAKEQIKLSYLPFILKATALALKEFPSLNSEMDLEGGKLFLKKYYNIGIAVDTEGMTYVVDAAFENVQIFNAQAEILMFFGGSYKGPGHMWLPAGIEIDYNNLEYFKKYLQPGFQLKHLIFVTNQYGPDRVNVYGFVEPAN